MHNNDITLANNIIYIPTLRRTHLIYSKPFKNRPVRFLKPNRSRCWKVTAPLPLVCNEGFMVLSLQLVFKTIFYKDLWF